MVDKSKLRNSPTVKLVNKQIDQFKKYLMRQAIELSNPNPDHNPIPDLQLSIQSFLLSMVIASQKYTERATGIKPPIDNSIRNMVRERSNDFLNRFLANYTKVTNIKVRQAELSADDTNTLDWMFDRDSSDALIGMYNQSLNLFFVYLPSSIITKIFTTMEDEKVCEDCDGLDGEEYDQNDEAPDIPDDTHPNCRCWYVIAINGVPQDDI